MKNVVANRRQLALLGVLLAVLVLALVKMRGGTARQESLATAPARSMAAPGEERPGPVRPRGRAEKKVNWDEVPILSPKDFVVERSSPKGAERNLFDLRAPSPTPAPTATPAPPPPPGPGDPRFIGPLPPPGPTPTPRPPEITFKFLGTFGPRDKPIAVLAQGSETVNAREGDIVFQHFVIRKIGYESVDVGFTGPWKETRRLGLTQ
ncbi:MAG TPA: hypothetical protein VKJ00_14210 [Thermoanaerobaculia bacterium]|nr:hypothetical protein [Thermoanaerobaculia bacterium]